MVPFGKLQAGCHVSFTDEWLPNFVHFRIMEATVLLGTFNAEEMFCFPSPDLRLNTILSEFYGQFLRPHGLVFALTCSVNCGTLYRQLCAFRSHVQSIEFTTGGLNQVVETSQG